MTDLIQVALKKILDKQLTKDPQIEEPDEIVSRNDIVKKVKTFTESVKEFQIQRLKTFFPKLNLKKFLTPQSSVQNKAKKEVRFVSNFLNLNDIKDLEEIEGSAQDISDSSDNSPSSDSGSSHPEWVAIFPNITLRFPLATTEHLEARQKLESLEKEFTEKLRVKVDKRPTQTVFLAPGSIFNLSGCRSYVKFAPESYKDENVKFSKMYVILSKDNIVAKRTASSNNNDILIPFAKVREIISLSAVSVLYFIYSGIQYNRCMAVSPYTEEDFKRWNDASKNLSKINSVSFKTFGEIPKRLDEDAPNPKTRSSIYHRVTNSKIIDEEEDEEERLSKSCLNDSRTQEDLSEQTWDYDFEKLDQEKSKSSENEEQSFSSDQGLNDEEKVRSLTALAKSGHFEGLVNLLTKGGLFLKYGRWGSPHTRHVLLTGDLKYVEWWHLNENKASGQMLVIKVISVQKGRKTKNFERFQKPGAEDSSFSLICKQRTIDLELAKDNRIPADVWILAFEALIKQQLSKNDVKRCITKQSSIPD